MTQQVINVGEGANSGTGDSIRDAFVKVNNNFNEIYFNGVSNNVQEFITNLNTTTYISTTTMNVLAKLLYTSTATLTTRVGIVETNANTLTNRVVALETTVASGLGAVSSNLGAAINTLTTTVTNLTIRIGNIERAATTLTNTVTKLTTTVTNLTTAFNTVASTVTNLTTRVASIETSATTLTNTVTNLVIRMGTAESYLVPKGVIMMWSGAASAVPTGYAVCDGKNSTPDLRDRFVIGAGNTYIVGATGGSADAVVVSHSHTTSAISTSTVSETAHSHNMPYSDGQNSPKSTDTTRDEYGAKNSTTTTESTTTGITVDTSVSVTVDSNGVAGTSANLPPYYALCFIMKT